MARWNLLMAAVATAAGTIGCAHYDTVDDFPVPCVGANCAGGSPIAYGGPGMGAPAGDAINSPSSELGPYGSQGGATAGSSEPAAPEPAVPNPPGDPGLLPPSDSPPARPDAPGA